MDGSVREDNGSARARYRRHRAAAGAGGGQRGRAGALAQLLQRQTRGKYLYYLSSVFNAMYFKFQSKKWISA